MLKRLKDKLKLFEEKVKITDNQVLSDKSLLGLEQSEIIHHECQKAIENLKKVIDDCEETGDVNLSLVNDEHYLLNNFPYNQKISYNSDSDINGLYNFLNDDTKTLEILVVPKDHKKSFLAKRKNYWDLESGEHLDLYLDFNGGYFYNLIHTLKTFNLGEPLINHEFIEDEYTIKLKQGLHARPAANLIEIFNTYPHEIDIHCKKNESSGKSMLGFLMLEATKGSEVIFKYKLPEQDCLNKIETLEHLFNIRQYVSEYVQGKIDESTSYQKFFDKISHQFN